MYTRFLLLHNPSRKARLNKILPPGGVLKIRVFLIAGRGYLEGLKALYFTGWRPPVGEASFITWVPREQNASADFCCNHCMRRGLPFLQQYSSDR